MPDTTLAGEKAADFDQRFDTLLAAKVEFDPRPLVRGVQEAISMATKAMHVPEGSRDTALTHHDCQLVQCHLADDLSVDVLASVAKMSKRNFARIFLRDTNVTPTICVQPSNANWPCHPDYRFDIFAGLARPRSQRPVWQRPAVAQEHANLAA